MIIVTTDSINKKDVKEVVGLVKGSTVRSKHVGRDIGAAFKTLVGGEIEGYTEMLNEARKIAIGRMVEDAESKGANAIVGMKLQSSAVMQGASEIMAYGTAVVIKE
jgi:uncharacterized protein YbjQ (UPF0145 family)